jgi:hypothetical protein
MISVIGIGKLRNREESYHLLRKPLTNRWIKLKIFGQFYTLRRQLNVIDIAQAYALQALHLYSSL